MGKMPTRDRQHVDDYIAQVRKPHEREGYADAGPYTKGGNYRGGPKRWTGSGPAPARHIPWPELFKHHISVIEGHLKMVDMVRKHTVEDSSNWHMIRSFVDRAQEMLGATKKMSRSFVEPPGHRERVPLGSSSASMYPGYSPADHIYGEAAEEAGKVAAEAKTEGKDIEHFGGIQYKYGQSRGSKGKTLEEIRAEKAAKEGEGLDTTTNGTTTAPPDQNGEADEQTDRPLFVIDTQPMDLDLPDLQQSKRSHNSVDSTADTTKKAKKSKTKHEGDLPNGNEEEDDISAEVDAKLKEKKEKRLKKEEKKKRKRETDDSLDVAVAVPAVGEGGVDEKPQKKKKKKEKEKEKQKDGDGVDGKVEGEARPEKRGGEDVEGGVSREEKKKKRRKKEKREKEE